MYENGSFATQTVEHLLESLVQYAHGSQGSPAIQLLVIDDGSEHDPFPTTEIPHSDCLHVVRLEQNQGRSVARNVGLRESTGFDMTMFVDSDILVQNDQVLRNVEQFVVPGSDALGKVIVANFFATVYSTMDSRGAQQALQMARVNMDWRWDCVYQPSWIGCPEDAAYVGSRYRLVTDTDYFRSWSGMVGPWCLANMVLGGCFTVPTDVALELNGFDESFSRYGFTETTLVAKLIANGIPVVPQTQSAAVHRESNPADISPPERTVRFRAVHHKFFTDFLNNRI